MFSPPMAYPNRCRPNAQGVALSSPSMRPVRWCRRCMSRPKSIAFAAAHILLIGHAGHPEVIGTNGAVAGRQRDPDRDAGRCAISLSAARCRHARLRHPDHALGRRHRRHRRGCCKPRFPPIAGPHKEDICYATTNRQEAVKLVAPHGRCDDRGRSAEFLEFAAVEGSRRTRWLRRAQRLCSAPAISTGAEFGSIAALGLTAGASAPDVLVEEVIGAFAARYDPRESRRSRATEENMFFPLPRPLRQTEAAE